MYLTFTHCTNKQITELNPTELITEPYKNNIKLINLTIPQCTLLF